jgi:hypothetical protein
LWAFFLLFPPEVGYGSATLALYWDGLSVGIIYAPIGAVIMGFVLFGSFFASVWISIFKTRVVVRAIVFLGTVLSVPGFIVVDFLFSLWISIAHLSLLAVFIGGPQVVALDVMALPTYANMTGFCWEDGNRMDRRTTWYSRSRF